MKKTFMVSALMLLVILASCTGGQKTPVAQETAPTVQEVSPVANETATSVDESIAAEVATPIVLAEGFIEYDESLIGAAEDTVLFFHAEWCGSCKAAEASLIETWVPEWLTVLKVDFEASENLELRQKYGVTTKHTFVQVDANGDLIKKWQGSTGLADIQEEINWDTTEEAVSVEAAPTADETTSAVVEIPVALAAGTFTDYDESLVGTSEDTVVFFHAEWCPSCKAAEAGITSGEIPEGLTVLKADFDTSIDLKKKYGVVAQHTFVQIDSDGNEVKKWVGGTNVASIVERLK